MSSLRDRVHQARRFIPLPVLLRLGRRRVAALWENEQWRAAQEANMQFILEHTERAAEIPQIAREYAEFDVLRNYRRWHPGPLIRQEVRGIEWLTTKRDPARGVVLNFMHHGQYDGLVGSLARCGVEVNAVIAPDGWDPDAPLQIRQHYKVCSTGSNVNFINAAHGVAPLIEALERREVMVIASDVAGRTPVKFLGRDLLGSFGAARIAAETNSPVVLLTSHQHPDGSPYLQLHEPLEPKDFADPSDLLREIFRRHEPAVLAWPAAYDSPVGRLLEPTKGA